MSLPETIAHYRITAKLGEGGMGEVYRATDKKLGREVAIKIISKAFAQDAERMARFTREAQVLASLNHPNIAAVYGVEDGALVMELVDGPTLAERIKKGALPLTQALEIACQIVDALDAAHERGIIHRDLKPANIKITPNGNVKILDFGLAKVAGPRSLPSGDDTQPLTLTEFGTILGTPSYMAPEQAQGKTVDKRADIWAFGVVVYEMVTGRRLFQGATAAEVLSAVLTREPDWDQVPARARRLLRHCLEKDPKHRLRDIAEARFILEESPPAAVRARPLPWMVAAGVLATALAAVSWMIWRTPPPQDRPLVRLNVDLGPEAIPGALLETILSPDGTRVAFVARSPEGKSLLAVRPLTRPQMTLLAGTENAASPFFSPDGRWIGFFSDGKLKKVAAQGGAVVTIANIDGVIMGGSWGDDQEIVVAGNLSPLQRVSANGGTPRPLLTKAGTKLGEQGDTTHRWPQVLPGARAVLFTSQRLITGFDDAAIEAVVTATGERKTLLRGGYFGRYLAAGPHRGFLLYVREGALFAVPFDPNSLTVEGTASPVLDDIAGDTDSGAGQFDCAGTGTLVYRSGAGTSRRWPILWLDSSGKTEPLLAEPGAYYTMRFSPDGKRLAMMVDHGDKGREIEVYDWQRGSLVPLTATGQVTAFPIWSPDGKYIVFEASSEHGYGIAVVRSDGSGKMQRLGENSGLMIPFSFSADWHLIHSGGGIWSTPFDTSDPDHPQLGKPVRLPRIGGSPNVSPDGRWIAYRSEESGRSEVYVQPFPIPGARWQISIGGTAYTSIDWAPNGGELYFVGSDNRMMVAEYTVKGDTFIPGKPRVWSNTPIGATPFPRNFSLSPDGKRFAVMPPRSVPVEKGAVHVTFVMNFLEDLERRLK